MEGVVRSAEPEAAPAFPDRFDRPGAAGRSTRRFSVASIALLLVLFVVTALGFYLRLWIIGHAPINSDEAVVGLMAKGILHGHFSAFFWGQSYGGVEPYAVAAVFSVAGQSAFALTLAPALLSLIAVVVVWRLGRRLFGRAPALVAAVLAWIWCESSLWNATREYGFHEVELVLGLLVLLQVVRIRDAALGDRGDRVVDWFVVGALVGLGWWAAPEIVYFAVPGAVFLVISLWRRPIAAVGARVGVAVGGFFVFASPWFVASFSDHFATLRASGGTPLPGNGYPDRLSTFFSHVLPMILGLRVEGAGVWEVSQKFGVAVYVALLVALVASLVLIAYRVPAARPLAAVAVAYPLLYAAFPSAWFWNDGRYAISLTPVVALVLVGGLWTAVSGAVVRWASIVVLVAATASTLVAFNDSFGAVTSLRKLTTWGTHPNSVAVSLGDALHAHRVRDVYAGYWVAYDLQFTSGDGISVMSVDPDRDVAESQAVQQAPRAGWVFVGVAPTDQAVAEAQFGSAAGLDADSIIESALVGWLTAHGVSYTTFRSGPMEVVLPARNVTPAQVNAQA